MPWADALGVGVANKCPERAKEASQSRCVPEARYPINRTLSASIVWGEPRAHTGMRAGGTLLLLLGMCKQRAGGCIQIPHTVKKVHWTFESIAEKKEHLYGIITDKTQKVTSKNSLEEACSQ